MSLTYEIERKFLVASLPPQLADAPRKQLRQGYLASDENEVRLRQSDGDYTLTCKRGDGLKRLEQEISLSPEQFETLWPLTEGKRIEKVRYCISHEALTIELDVYAGALHPLQVAEVEFESVEQSEAFSPPPYLAAEITSDTRYKNRSLAEQGLPSLSRPSTRIIR